MATEDLDIGVCHDKDPGKKFNQVGVGLAIHRGSADADLHMIAMQTDDLIPAGPGLYAYPEQKVWAPPHYCWLARFIGTVHG
jgi:hypothetical protein